MTNTERQKAYKFRNKDRWNEIRRKSYARHKDSRKKSDKAYRDKNYERLSVRRKQYYIDHREILTFQQRQRNKTIRYKIHLWRKRKVWKLDFLIFILFYQHYVTEMQYAKFVYLLSGGITKQLPTIERKRLRQVNVRYVRNVNFLDEVYI